MVQDDSCANDAALDEQLADAEELEQGDAEEPELAYGAELELGAAAAFLLAYAEELMQAYEESTLDAPEAEEPAAGTAAWKVFLILGLLTLGCIFFLLFKR